MSAKIYRSHAERWKCVDERISKKLSYVLKYGAEQEGLEIDDKGFVSFDALMCLPQFNSFTRDQVLQVISQNCSSRGVFRFHKEERAKTIFVRHNSMKHDSLENLNLVPRKYVLRLSDQAVKIICDNIMWPQYRNLMLQVDNFIILEEIITRLRTQGRLNNKTLSVMLVPCLNKLNFDGCLLTKNTLKMIGNNCVTLRNLVLRNHSYIITDSSLKELIKNLSALESLNLADCHHLTDSSIHTIISYLPNIQRLNLSSIPSLTTGGLIELVSYCHHLKHLDVYGVKIRSKFTENDFNKLITICKEKGITIISEQLRDDPAADTN